MTGYSLDVWVRHAVLRAENVERTKAPLRRGFLLSGRPDLNRGPLVPQTSALTRLRHAPNGAQSSRIGVHPVERAVRPLSADFPLRGSTAILPVRRAIRPQVVCRRDVARWPRPSG
jgi:hypothetical protein